MIGETIAGRQLTEVLATIDSGFAPAIQTVVSGSWRSKTRDAVRGSGYVVHSLEAALWRVANAGGSYPQAVLTAANLGEDADTTAAITGRLAGAAAGISAIPDELCTRLAWSERIKSMALALVDQSFART